MAVKPIQLTSHETNSLLPGSFGHLLMWLRERDRPKITQAAVARKIAQLSHVPFSRPQYSRLEADLSYPRFDQLSIIYCALRELGISISDEERKHYISFARRRIEQKATHHEQVGVLEWKQLSDSLEIYEQQNRSASNPTDRHGRLMLTPSDAEHVIPAEPQKNISPRHVEVERALRIDTSYIIGRMGWVEEMCTYLQCTSGTPRKKIMVTKAMMGAGKTACFELLFKQLAQRATVWPFLHLFNTQSKDLTPSDHLDIFLAKLLAYLQIPQPEATSPVDLDERIEQVLTEMMALDERIVILLDDAQVMLESNGELQQGWQQFFKAFLRDSHMATLYIATREWPNWLGKAYVVQQDLAPLTPEAGVEIWRRLGFEHEDAVILKQATTKCAGNVRMMEVVAQHLQKPVASHSWGTLARYDVQDSNTMQGLKRFVEDPHLLSRDLLVEAYPFIDQIVTTHISSDARRLLTTLAVANMPLASALLKFLCQAPGARPSRVLCKGKAVQGGIFERRIQA